MKQTFNLSQSTLIFYSLLAPFIVVGSGYNLIYGIILGKTPTISLGAFGIFGFIILPLLLVSTYVRNRCTITNQNVRINKTDYPKSEYDFIIKEKLLAVKDRPLFSLFTKTFHTLAIKQKSTGNVILEQDLETSTAYTEKLKAALN